MLSMHTGGSGKADRVRGTKRYVVEAGEDAAHPLARAAARRLDRQRLSARKWLSLEARGQGSHATGMEPPTGAHCGRVGNAVWGPASTYDECQLGACSCGSRALDDYGWSPS